MTEHGATELLLNLVAGVALLLWGVRMVRTGMTRAFGAQLRRYLGHAMRNRLQAFVAGIGVTALLQSSTATAMIVSSFAGRGLLAGGAAIAVLLGAGIGTSITAQYLSLDLHWLGPLCIILGVIGFFAAESGMPRHVGRLGIGIGLMLLSLEMIIGASAPLRDAPGLAAILLPLEREPVLGVLLFALLTWLSHASLATVLLAASLAKAGTVDATLAVALVIGANIGTAISPLVASTGQPPAARRAQLANLLTRVIATLALLPFIDQLPHWLAYAGGDGARMAVNAHTAYNLAVAVIFLPFVTLLDKLAKRLMPDAKESAVFAPRYLDESALDTPSVALAAAARETLRMSDIVAQMLNQTMTVFTRDDAKLAKAVEQSDDSVDRLHEAIKLYLTELSKHGMDEAESRRYVDVLTFTTNLEHIGDIIDKNLMELAQKKIKNKLTFSKEGLAELTDFHRRVAANLQMACNLFMAGDPKLARQLLQEKAALREAEQLAAEHHYQRIREGRAESIETSAIHLDVIRDLKRINSHLTAVAYPILEQTGELTATRLRADKRPDLTSAQSAPGGGLEAGKNGKASLA
ncbi:Na/Pi cotransporter family protein [uncultured Ferrovibrio sp.]|jgi:phosphate:Na+ symporter|uniref:Na/Pi cotransporter family protein n=1 Tax=uncultured Ferrovibrio sp. TaxID=1576913 RepID=UPI00260F68C2|nr:Na/Pi cotransporter family protein [uncultured Ferrovibrio sp.]